MAIALVCEGCGKKLNARESLAGRTVACPACRAPVTVPHPVDEVEEVDPWDAPASPPPEVNEYAIAGRESDSGAGQGGADGDPFDSAFQPSRPVAEPGDEELPVRTRKRKNRGPKKKTAEEEFESPGPDLGRYLYLAILISILPLGIHLLSGPDDTEQRLARTLEKNHVQAAVETQEDVERVLAQLPDRKIEGAFLPRDSLLHWAIAGAAVVVFFGAILALIPRGETGSIPLLSSGLFTGTAGLGLLISLQFIAALSLNFRPRGKAAILWLILIAIAFSYRAALDPEMSFVPSLFGFMFGVGLCEELAKALPLLYAQKKWGLDWRGACAWGFASGAGFGIAEGIHYSGSYYNGLEPLSMYLVRFISCVGLHAMWSATCGVLLFRNAEIFDEEFDWTTIVSLIGRVLLVPMILHALYDTLLKYDMNAGALGVAVASFLFMAGVIEWTAANEAQFEAEEALA